MVAATTMQAAWTQLIEALVYVIYHPINAVCKSTVWLGSGFLGYPAGDPTLVLGR